MESWNFSSEAKTIFFSSETATSSMGLGLSEILCSNMISPNSSSLSLVDDEPGSRALSSLMEPNTNNDNIRDSSLIALKLGSQTTTSVDHCLHLRETTQISSSSSSSPFKRARTRGSYSQTTPYCQVLGCNMDLSGSKDYHKKHKVCDIHSKTSTVIVNGVQQRFCQQCSRFHLLKEFDDGKRSCRRRLAGHNERRRKPQCDNLSDKPHKYSHSYQGNRYPGTSSQSRMPFVFSDILPGVVLSPENYDQINPFGQTVNSQLFSHGIESRYRSPEEEEDCFFESAPTLQRPLGAAPSAPRAHSFLSSQSQSSPCHLAGIPMPHGGAHQTVPQLVQEKPPRARLGPYSSSGIELFEVGPVMVPELTRAADFEAYSDRAFHGSNCLRHKYCLADPGNGSTVDLLQLSSHLQRVEHQRSFMQVKQENDDFCCFPTA